MEERWNSISLSNRDSVTGRVRSPFASAEGAGMEGSSDPRLEGWTMNATAYREIKLQASPGPELGLAGTGPNNQYFEPVSHQLLSFHDQHLA